MNRFFIYVAVTLFWAWLGTVLANYLSEWIFNTSRALMNNPFTAIFGAFFPLIAVLVYALLVVVPISIYEYHKLRASGLKVEDLEEKE